MQVFLSHASEDVDLVKKLQRALESRNIKTSSMLDARAGERWSQQMDQASASADAFIFLLGTGASANPYLRAEWQALLRNDWDGKKPMIPVFLNGQGSELPKFLTNTNPLVNTNFDQLVEQIEHVIRNPAEARASEPSEKARAEQKERLEDLRAFAEALKRETDPDEGAIPLS